MLRGRIVLLTALSLCSAGCGASLSQRPVKSDAELGRVIIYRSGVAYFERHAVVKNGKLTLSVPAERVDDFLKSLTVRERKTGKSLPVSFPTVVRHGDRVELVIELPRDAPRELAVTYVTESAAWKPSYRIELGPGGRGKLEAWAIVDNVSGEDWEHVTVGVGSTSALSFKYDLHSVRFVERETLNDGPALAHAPPSGGSPYEVAGREVAVIGNIDLDTVDRMSQAQQFNKQDPLDGNLDKSGDGGNDQKVGGKARKPATEGSGKHRARQLDVQPNAGEFVPLAEKLKSSGQRFRIEGYAKPGEADTKNASQNRANSIKNALVANGVSEKQLEAVGTGQVSNRDGVRIIAAAEALPAQAKTPERGA